MIFMPVMATVSGGSNMTGIVLHELGVDMNSPIGPKKKPTDPRPYRRIERTKLRTEYCPISEINAAWRCPDTRSLSYLESRFMKWFEMLPTGRPVGVKYESLCTLFYLLGAPFLDKLRSRCQFEPVVVVRSEADIATSLASKDDPYRAALYARTMRDRWCLEHLQNWDQFSAMHTIDFNALRDTPEETIRWFVELSDLEPSEEMIRKAIDTIH